MMQGTKDKHPLTAGEHSISQDESLWWNSSSCAAKLQSLSFTSPNQTRLFVLCWLLLLHLQPHLLGAGDVS